jgi:hypothetical protein
MTGCSSCDGSGGQLCLSLLEQHSTTTNTSSENSQRVLGLSLGGESGLNAEVLASNGNISESGGCQTAHRDSNGASVAVGDQPVVDALQGSSTSDGCAGTVQNESTTLALGGQGLPIPTSGCDDGTANSVFDALSPLLATVCGADDTNGSQTSPFYGVREALAAFVLIMDDTSLLKVSAGNAESHALPPGGDGGTPPTGTTPGGAGGSAGAGGKGGGAGGAGGGAGEGGAGAGGGPAAGAAQAGSGNLAFTGADLLALGMVGGALILGGLALTTTAGRRHRQTV